MNVSRSSAGAPSAALRPRLIGLALSVGLFLAACSSGKSPGAPPTAGSQAPEPPAPAAQAASALRTEQRWLQSWFEGTPVRIVMTSDGVLAIDVPREFCFDAGRSQVKPALAAVLDKVALSLRRNTPTKLTLLAAPGDARPSAPLAMARSAAVHKHLLNRGVPAARLGEPGATAAAEVQLRIEAPPF